MALGLLHALLGVIAGRKLDLAGKRQILEPLDAVLHRRGVGAQHVQAGAIGDDVDLDVLVLAAIIFDHVGGVVEREVHHLWIVLIDLDRDAMRFGIGREAADTSGIENNAAIAKRE